MTKCSWPRCGATPTPSIRDLNPPIITFVGRLDASQKGHDVLLDAIDLLDQASMPRFCVWLVGGAADEALRVLEEIRSRPGCRSLHDDARLLIWGRVDGECLPEIYSRSSLVVMPSRRETFGLVAVEAMLCHTAVAASFVGGLKHTVVHRETGIHFAPGDAPALAFITRSLILNHRLAAWLGNGAGRWAREAFGHSSPKGGLERILRVHAGQKLEPNPIERTAEFFLAEDMNAVENWLGPGHKAEPIASYNNHNFKVRCPAGEMVFVKRFTTRPDSDFSIYRLECTLTPSDWRARLARTLAAGVSPFVLPVRDLCDGMALFDWAEPVESASYELTLEVAHRFSSSIAVPSSALATECGFAAEALFRSGSWADLNAFDSLAAKLNAPFNGREDVFVRCDPRVEIKRLQMHLDENAWPIPADLRLPMRAVLDQAAAVEIDCMPPPLVRHGDLRARHIVKRQDNLMLCDLEETRIAFGDLDAGSFLLQQTSPLIGAMPITSVKGALRSLFREAVEQDLAALWFVAQAFHLALDKCAWGSFDGLRRAVQLCECMLES